MLISLPQFLHFHLIYQDYDNIFYSVLFHHMHTKVPMFCYQYDSFQDFYITHPTTLLELKHHYPINNNKQFCHHYLFYPNLLPYIQEQFLTQLIQICLLLTFILYFLLFIISIIYHYLQYMYLFKLFMVIYLQV